VDHEDPTTEGLQLCRNVCLSSQTATHYPLADDVPV